MLHTTNLKALVVGATGAVGKDLIDQLLQDDAFESVVAFVRRPLAVENPKLTVHVIDFDRPEQWRQLLEGDVLFSCLGTTIRAAGSQANQWKVDYTYQYEAAKAARENGVETYALVSSIGADPKSKIFYTRMKGELEVAVKKLGFPACYILQPPSLVRKGSDRFGEKAGVVALRAFNAIGLMRVYKPMPTEEVAAAMVRLVKGGRRATETIVAQDILKA